MIKPRAPAAPSTRDAHAHQAPQGFRPEIQALRAVAVGLVLLFHLWPNRFTGGYVGVDVFFVISGFLITSHLAKELVATNRIQLRHFYARRIRRLLPAALLVLAVTLVVSLLFARAADLAIILRDILASALYSVNWVLASASVDYFAAEDAASPLQHYWSLAVEEQFYLVWPLILIVAWTTRKMSTVVVTLGIVFAASLAYSVWGSLAFPTFAYFSTAAHGWEFAAGAILALAMRKRPISPWRWWPLLSWAGWIAIVGSAFLFNAGSPFPGWIALLPVLGTLAVIVAGSSSATWSPALVANSRPVQFLGDISYSLYLWHFPLIVLAPMILSRSLDTFDNFGIVVACVLLAWLTKRFVEDPARTWPKLHTLRLTYLTAGAATIALVAATVVPLTLFVSSYADSSQRVYATIKSEIATSNGVSAASVDANCLGALAGLARESCPDSHTPANGYGPQFASVDVFNRWREHRGNEDPYFIPDCETVPGTGISECWYRSGDEDAFTIAIAGDSHAGHWLPAILALGREHGWNVIRYSKTGCRLALGAYEQDTDYGIECERWKTEVIPYLASAPWIDMVTTSASTNSSRRDHEELAGARQEAFLRAWQPLLDSGKKVVVMSDGPAYRSSIPNCVESEIYEPLPCSASRESVSGVDPIVGAAQRINDENFAYFDTLSIFCDSELCHPVVGGLITHKDRGHIAATFMVTVAPILASALEGIAPEAFASR